jgi:hypothetical protein
MINMRQKSFMRLGGLALFVFVFGCAESNFRLAAESRLPRWFTLPAGLSRRDVTVSLTYYAVPAGKATFKFWDSQGQKLAELTAPVDAPRALEPNTNDPYPMYQVITYNGVTEVIEHRRMDPWFYITDDPLVRQKLGVIPAAK